MLSLFIEVFFIGVPVESALQPLAVVLMFILFHLFQSIYGFLHNALLLDLVVHGLLLFILMLIHMLLFKDFHNLLVLVFDGMLNFVA